MFAYALGQFASALDIVPFKQSANVGYVRGFRQGAFDLVLLKWLLWVHAATLNGTSIKLQ